jgi:hypothetical protein
MIKVAVVGTNGLAQYIANSIATQTSHQFVVLSRRVCEPPSGVSLPWLTYQAESRSNSKRMASTSGESSSPPSVHGACDGRLEEHSSSMASRRLDTMVTDSCAD